MGIDLILSNLIIHFIASYSGVQNAVGKMVSLAAGLLGGKLTPARNRLLTWDVIFYNSNLSHKASGLQNGRLIATDKKSST